MSICSTQSSLFRWRWTSMISQKHVWPLTLCSASLCRVVADCNDRHWSVIAQKDASKGLFLSPAALVWWLQARLAEETLATAKQHLIACRNRAQTYLQKLPNAPSEFLEKISRFLSPAPVAWWLQAASIRLAEGPLATAKQHLIACRNRAQTYLQKLPNAPSEFLEKISRFLSPAALVWWLQAASIRLAEETPRHSETAPNCVPKPCSNLPTKTA